MPFGNNKTLWSGDKPSGFILARSRKAREGWIKLAQGMPKGSPIHDPKHAYKEASR